MSNTRRIARLFDWLDAVEFAIPAILAMLLLLAGPPLAAAYFLRAGHYSAALGSGGLWLLAVIALIRDARRRRFTWFSGSLTGLWLIATIVAWWMIETS